MRRYVARRLGPLSDQTGLDRTKPDTLAQLGEKGSLVQVLAPDRPGLHDREAPAVAPRAEGESDADTRPWISSR